MKNNMSWKKVKSKCLFNLSVFSINGVEVGFIHRFRNTRYTTNYFQSYVGIGNDARFVGHGETAEAAKILVEINF